MVSLACASPRCRQASKYLYFFFSGLFVLFNFLRSVQKSGPGRVRRSTLEFFMQCWPAPFPNSQSQHGESSAPNGKPFLFKTHQAHRLAQPSVLKIRNLARGIIRDPASRGLAAPWQQPSVHQSSSLAEQARCSSSSLRCLLWS